VGFNHRGEGRESGGIPEVELFRGGSIWGEGSLPVLEAFLQAGPIGVVSS